MGVIKPTLSLSSNAHTSTKDAGPGSVVLSLSVSDSLTVDLAEQQLIETSTTLNANANGDNGPIDGSALAGGDGESGITPGSVGGFVYLKNNSTTTDEMIYIAIVTGGGSQSPAAPAVSGTTALDESYHETLRTFTLLPGEFAWFPWDYTGDIHWEAKTGTPELEYWRWDRG